METNPEDVGVVKTGGGRVVGRWVTDEDKTKGNKDGEDGGDEVRGGEVAEVETGRAVVGETRRGDSAGGNAGVAKDTMEEHTDTKGDIATAGRVAPTESIVETTKADEEEVANRKGAARVTNGMEGVTKVDEDAGAIGAGALDVALVTNNKEIAFSYVVKDTHTQGTVKADLEACTQECARAIRCCGLLPFEAIVL
ncbi:hypothetical protein CBR_g21844 [Chara braunii]|uniref:Uncharacterized protein n=1 Tax=Chara braunii TaxID=69332 RepID=A0A388JUM2_CHABU|nr:hypothetical protein CBR_g21844 [Chara braunii]|eukprot:GBG61501.1 hypothetical protein CBR_g21844 [Chara braunii]